MRQSVRDQLGVDEALLDQVCSSLGVRMLVLFGSRATGTPPPMPESDLDLAVSMVERDEQRGFWDIYRELNRVFSDASLDLAFLKDADPLFRWEIMRAGVLLWGDPDDFLDFRAFAFRDFVDSADLRALERTLFAKKLAYLRRHLHAAA